MVVLWRQLSNPSSPLKRALTAYRRIDLSGPCPRSAPRSLPRTIHRLTPAEVDEAVAGYKAGATLSELAARLRVDRKTLSPHLKARGVQLRRTMTPAEVEQAVKLYAQGLSVARIADRLGYHTTSVYLKMRAAGVPMRDAHGRER
jgi:AraC-like DNA-binding protein